MYSHTLAQLVVLPILCSKAISPPLWAGKAIIPCGLDHLYPPPSKGRCFRRPSTLRSLSQPSGQPPVFRAATRDGEPLDIRPVATRRWTGGLTLPLLFRRQEFQGALRQIGRAHV